MPECQRALEPSPARSTDGDALAFYDREDAVDTGDGDFFDGAAGPVDLEPSHIGSSA